jgi:ribonuclease P protein component
VPGATPRGRFPREQRVRKRREFEAAQAGGRKATTSHFVLIVWAREEAGAARLGIVASRKVGSAVVRNRAKRLVREAFRATRELWMSGIDLVVIVRRSLDKMKLADVEQEWRSVRPLAQKRMHEARRDLVARRARATHPAELEGTP